MILHNIILFIAIWIRKIRGKYLFKQWIELEGKKEKVIQAVVNKSPDFPDLLLGFIATALGVSYKYYEKADWIEIIKAFYVCLSLFPTIKLPITEYQDNKKDEKPSWEYDGRVWHFYSHLLASAYGWSLEYISHLHPVEAIAKIQEILTDRQLEQEFYYGLSEIAYPYNSSTKQNNYKPLERPYWMRTKMQPIPKFKIPASMIPPGVVIADNVLPEEYLPKEIIH